MAYEFYVTVDGIPGESTRKGHKDKIVATAFSYAVQAPVSGGAGKPTQTPVTITKRFDRATPKLFESIVKGKHLKFVLIEFERKVAGTPVVYYTLRLDDVTITHLGQYTDGSQPGPGGACEFETVSFWPQKIRIEHRQFDSKGGVTGATVVEWNWKTMK